MWIYFLVTNAETFVFNDRAAAVEFAKNFLSFVIIPAACSLSEGNTALELDGGLFDENFTSVRGSGRF